MATSTLVLIFVGGSFWISMMILAVVLPLFPKALRVTAPLICRSGEKMEIHVGKASYHRPGERGLAIECVGTGRRTVTLRAFFLAWVVLSILILIIGMAVLLAVKGL